MILSTLAVGRGWVVFFGWGRAWRDYGWMGGGGGGGGVDAHPASGDTHL